MSNAPFLTVLVPTLGEAEWIADTLASVRAALQASGIDGEVIVCDGGSRDGTRETARRAGADRVVESETAGRPAQLNLGARRASGRVLVFLHADSLVDPRWAVWMRRAFDEGAVGGWFQVDILPETSAGPTVEMLDLVARSINWRTRRFRTATGDQSIFVCRDVFESIGGVPDRDVLEGFLLARRIASRGRVAIGGRAVRISGRRWERGGPIRTSLLMHVVRLGFLCGVPADVLARLWRDNS